MVPAAMNRKSDSKDGSRAGLPKANGDQIVVLAFNNSATYFQLKYTS